MKAGKNKKYKSADGITACCCNFKLIFRRAKFIFIKKKQPQEIPYLFGIFGEDF